MFSGRWELKKGEDGSCFIDRDAFVFRHILNFMRGQPLNLESLTQQEKETLLLDAKFYQLIPLIDLLEPKIKDELTFTPGQNYALSNGNKKAIKTSETGFNAVLLGNKRYSKGSHEWTITHSDIHTMVGVAPFDIDRITPNMYNQCGWYFYVFNSTLHSGPPMSFNNEPYSKTGQLKLGSTIKVNLDMDKRTISFNINGTNYRDAYTNIPIDKELYSCILMYTKDGSVEIV